MRVRITPQYRAGRKLTPHQLLDVRPIVGTLELKSEKGRTVMQLWEAVGSVGGPTAELWLPVLAAMYSDTFRLTGIEKAAGGALVHQAWQCEAGGAWRHDEHRAVQRDLLKPANKTICNEP
ncbi:MAG: hypothetical protein EOO81_00795 [Oxalobacteraceae bacterium]|nr:MAG: hypothetical protein EOO81_00795 [Oxalobacteraceae bacterium]